MYVTFWKRCIDIVLSVIGLIILSPLIFILIVLGTILFKGNPFFVQKRPGLIDRKTNMESTVNMIKFRTMTNEKDPVTGNLLPDEQRLTKYGAFLRSTSLDEIGELFLCVSGSMSLVGPRPLLFRDMTFMTTEQRRRHSVRPGITGLAQVNGRNNMTWEQKLEYDLQYIDSGITFKKDLQILFLTVIKVFKREGITEEGSATATDFGDYLLQEGLVSREEYEKKQQEAKELLML